MFITRESHLCGCMLWRHRKSFRSTVRKIEQLLCRSSNLSFRPVFVYYRIKSRVKHETNPQVLFSSFVLSCADKFTGRLFWACLNTEMAKYRNVKIKSNLGHQKSCHSEAVRGKHGVPHMGGRLDLRRWSAVTWRKNSVGFPSQPNTLRGRQKDIAHPLLKSPRGL